MQRFIVWRDQVGSNSGESGRRELIVNSWRGNDYIYTQMKPKYEEWLMNKVASICRKDAQFVFNNQLYQLSEEGWIAVDWH